MIKEFAPFSLTLRRGVCEFEHPLVMGILNATPDSFYAGCRGLDEQSIAARVVEIVEQGADIIDVGAYSTRPGAADVAPSEEISRLRTAIAVVKREAPQVITSVDTFRATVAQVAVDELGVDIVNDVSGGELDKEMFSTVASLQVPYVLMHMPGTPATMQRYTHYVNVVEQVIETLAQRITCLREMGVKDVVADPGFGFGKTLEQNYELLAALEQFHALGVPLLVGVSRKSMIYRLIGCTPHEALNGSTVVHTLALAAGAHVLRVHDVREAVEARNIVQQARTCRDKNK